MKNGRSGELLIRDETHLSAFVFRGGRNGEVETLKQWAAGIRCLVMGDYAKQPCFGRVRKWLQLSNSVNDETFMKTM